MVSIKDIAKKCGVSVATVSKALNNQSDIASATKTKILKMAEDMDYMANLSARALRTNRTYNIGILFTNKVQGLAHEYFSSVLESFKSEAEDHGYDITFINDVIAGKKVTYKKHCEYRNFDGVAIILADFECKETKELASSEIPVVTIDHVYDNCTSVISNNISGMSELVEYAIKMGHKKIAYIHGEDTAVTNDRLTGFYATMRKYKLDVRDEYIKESMYHEPVMTNQKVKELLNLKNPPTCIILPDDYSSIIMAQTIKDSKKNISYIGYDGIEISKVMNITTYEQNKAALGKAAARKLIERIENPNCEVEHIIVKGRVVEGNTVKKIGDLNKHGVFEG